MAEQYTGHVIQTETETALSLVGVLVKCLDRIHKYQLYLLEMKNY